MYSFIQQNAEISIDNDDPLRVIYEDIIQPLIGDFFEVDAALCRRRNSSDNLLNVDNIAEACSCCTTFHRRRQYESQTTGKITRISC